ncbi:MAG: 1,4-dihydroxy-2-naphthoate polyprenyltransferase [Propionibacteriaceae bacterium]
MATFSQWLAGARPKTLPAALAPVLTGTGLAGWSGRWHLGMALLAFLVALALQIGVNFANDYSDGIRGTDAQRVGPFRLTASGAATPASVKWAAFSCFGIAALAGLVLVAWTGLWWLLIVGLAAILAAWFYTGGKHPYGYAGLGEVMVFIFFGLVAVLGTMLVQTGCALFMRYWFPGVCAACAIGLLACALLVVNNLRDIEGDRRSGKRTLATVLGQQGTRIWFALLGGLASVAVIAVAATTTWWALCGLILWCFLAVPLKVVLSKAKGAALIPALQWTGFAELACAVGLCVGFLLGAM